MFAQLRRKNLSVLWSFFLSRQTSKICQNNRPFRIFLILREKNLKAGDPCSPSFFTNYTKRYFACLLFREMIQNKIFLAFTFWKMIRNEILNDFCFTKHGKCPEIPTFFIVLLFWKIKFNGKKVLLILPYSTNNPLSHSPPPHNPLPSFPFPTPNPYTVFSFLPSCPDIIKKLWKKSQI